MSNCLEENLTETTSLTASNETPVLQHQNVANVLQCRKFRLQAYHIIHKSKKSLDELITKIYNTMRKKFFVGEKVYRIDGSGVVYTVVEDVSSCFRTRYKVQSAAITTLEVVNFSEIVRPHHVSKTDLKVLIDLFARRENGQWIVRRHYVECLGIAKEPEVEIPAEVLKIEKELIQGCFV
ncbi:hypothetical protein M3Y95_00748000 [Aphelenchoides besseyi]|nr:hypothetical protein M3Y95_00748000 [Aphelenchoides besseyi]